MNELDIAFDNMKIGTWNGTHYPGQKYCCKKDGSLWYVIQEFLQKSGNHLIYLSNGQMTRMLYVVDLNRDYELYDGPWKDQ